MILFSLLNKLQSNSKKLYIKRYQKLFYLYFAWITCMKASQLCQSGVKLYLQHFVGEFCYFGCNGQKLFVITLCYNPEGAHIEILIPPEILEKLRQHLLPNLPFPDKQRRYINRQPKPPLRELQKVLTIPLQMSFQIAPQTFILAKIPITDIDHSFYIWLNFQSFDLEQGIVKKQYLLAGEVVAIKSITSKVHAHVQIGLFGFGVCLLRVKAQVADAFAHGQALGEIKQLGKYALTSIGFGDED